MAAGTGTGGFGTTLKQAADISSLSGASVIGELRDFDGPGITGETVDITHNTSPSGYREYAPGLADGGEVTIDAVWTTAAYAALFALVRSTRAWRITLPDSGAATIDFLGQLTGLGVASPMSDAITMPITIKVSGLPVFTA